MTCVEFFIISIEVSPSAWTRFYTKPQPFDQLKELNRIVLDTNLKILVYNT